MHNICESNHEYPSTGRRDAERSILLWKFARRINSANEQTVSRFVGKVIKLHGKENSRKTAIVYLPPIRNPITEYSTVLECIIQSQALTKASTLKYTHITADTGAAGKFFQVIWNNSVEFAKVIIHLGDLHTFMFFGVNR